MQDAAREAVKRILPFPLTGAQRRVLREIADDLRSPHPMNRLVQGDVGSGKTLVALLAMVVVLENGYQSAFMAPTEILAEQHFLTLRRLLRRCPYRVELLTSAVKGKERAETLARIASGEAQIVIGTHALIQEGVTFGRLGLAVADEQHRFGVLQREDLRKKGYDADVLVMTATPIPRTLALTAYGDLDVSIVDEKPPGRTPIRTLLRPASERREVLDLVKRAVAQGRQAYVVYPLVEESEKLEDVKAATEASARVGGGPARRPRGPPPRPDEERGEGRDDGRLLPRRDPGARLDDRHRGGRRRAERHGHGRSSTPSASAWRSSTSCAAASGAGRRRPPACSSPTAGSPKWRGRASTSWSSTEDGFAIAEKDLEIRGPGDFFGTRQWGMPTFRVAHLLRDRDLLERARTEAFRLVGEGALPPSLAPLPREGRLGAPLRPRPRRVTAASCARVPSGVREGGPPG